MVKLRWLCAVALSGCALGDAIGGDRFERQDDGYVLDKYDHVVWEGTSTSGDLATVLSHCGAILSVTRTCASYWRLPTEREWAEDVLDIGSYALDDNDLNPPVPESPEALNLGIGTYWATIIPERPEVGTNVSGQWINVTTGVGDSAADSEIHQARCVCSE